MSHCYCAVNFCAHLFRLISELIAHMIENVDATPLRADDQESFMYAHARGGVLREDARHVVHDTTIFEPGLAWVIGGTLWTI